MAGPTGPVGPPGLPGATGPQGLHCAFTQSTYNNNSDEVIITVVAQFGSGSYTYSFSKVSGFGSVISVTGANADIQLGAGGRGAHTGVYQCVVTDAVYLSTQTVQCTVVLTLA